VAKEAQLSHVHYAAEQDANTLSRLTLLNDLRRAMEQDEFILHFQPKIDAQSDRVAGVEALCRWQHPERGLVFPDGFIEAIDSTNLSFPFTLHVIEKALAHTRSWLDRGHRLPVAVNVSSRCLMDRRLPDAVADLLQRAAVPADSLCLEVTESSLMTDPELAMAILARLRALGVRTSIDDFGAGYSSMTYLKYLPVDELKIDRSFVGDMCTDPRNSMLVQAAIDLGHTFGLEVVAEGIEDVQTYAALQRLGCDVAQGYYFARPLPADAFADWFDRHAAARAAEAA
jgi:EAL domain-containing protein (putative c-di-GMP-specific phosphodiesterase class I)